MDKSIKLSIIIVSYNTKDLLLDCISSIHTTIKKTPYEIIVVDNASTDKTSKELENKKSDFKNMKLIQN